MNTTKPCAEALLPPVWMAIAGAGLQVQVAQAHGHLADPPSRAALCHANHKNLNSNCGGAQYEPWSVGEAIGRFRRPALLMGKLPAVVSVVISVPSTSSRPTAGI